MQQVRNACTNAHETCARGKARTVRPPFATSVDARSSGSLPAGSPTLRCALHDHGRRLEGTELVGTATLDEAQAAGRAWPEVLGKP